MYLTLRQAWQSDIRFEFETIEKILCADLKGYPGRRDPLTRGHQEVARLYALVGEKGIGKTSWGKAFCRKHKLPMRFITFGEREAEDNLGIPAAGKDRKHHEMLAPPDFPSEPPELDITGPRDVLPGRDVSGGPFPGKGIVWVNEFCTADNKQESQLRSLITERRIGDNLVADGWLLIGDTNPMDARYQTVNQLDESIESRCYAFCVKPSYEATMAYWRESRVLSPRAYGFMRMNKSLYEMADNRRWTTVFDQLACIEAAGLNEREANALCIRLLELHIGQAVGQSYLKYTVHGDNPVFYPINARDYMEAEGDAHAEHVERLQAWTKNEDSASLIKHTLFDLVDWVKDTDRKFQDRDAERVVTVLKIGGLSASAQLMESMPRELNAKVMQLVRGTDFEKRLIGLQRRDAKTRTGI